MLFSENLLQQVMDYWLHFRVFNEKGKKASEIFNTFKATPQILENVKVRNKSIINSKNCRIAIKKSEKLIRNQGRMLVRKSGTEPKIRIMERV